MIRTRVSATVGAVLLTPPECLTEGLLCPQCTLRAKRAMSPRLAWANWRPPVGHSGGVGRPARTEASRRTPKRTLRPCLGIPQRPLCRAVRGGSAPTASGFSFGRVRYSQTRSYGLAPSSSANFQESTITVTAPEPTAATRTPPAAISRAVFEPRLLGIADRAGQRVDGAMGQLGDQDQGGPDHEQAPAPLIDAQERGRDHDQRAAIAVGEEARVAADRRLDPPPARRHLAACVAPVGLGGRVRRRRRDRAHAHRSREQAATDGQARYRAWAKPARCRLAVFRRSW